MNREKIEALNQQNKEEYLDPELYDQENERYQEDLNLLKEWAQQQGSPIIEIGCGTGRVTIPLAEAGFELIGVDLSKEMIAKAQEKSAAKGVVDRIRWEVQDVTRLNLGVQSPFLFMTGHTFQHFLSNQAQDECFQAINCHLSKDGILIFNTRFPSKEELIQPETEEYWYSYSDAKGRKVDVYTSAAYDPILQLQHYTTIRRLSLSSEANLSNEAKLSHQSNLSSEDKLTGDQQEVITRITLRYVYPQEMARLLQSHGFEILDVYESWDKKPLTPACYSMIYVCRKR